LQPEEQSGAGSTGVEANARLTAITSMVVLVLILAELVTVFLNPRKVLTVHDTIGLILVPVVALKLGSASWRLVGYYIRRKGYRELGPPAWFFRILGPIIGILTVALLASGVLLVIGPASLHSGALLSHKVSFYLWLIAVVAHAAPHMARGFRVASRDWSERFRGAVPGATLRLAAVVSCLAIGGLLAVDLANTSETYVHQYHATANQLSTPGR
jgi:hypothetical protein